MGVASLWTPINPIGRPPPGQAPSDAPKGDDRPYSLGADRGKVTLHRVEGLQMKLLLAAFLAAHALIHVSYLTPAPARTAGGPEWPFEMARSWLVTAAGLDPALARALGTALVIVTIALLVAGALATPGWLIPTAWWPALVVGGAVASALTLIIFFHPWLVLGLAIDAALLWAVLVASWTPATLQ
jgi:hypothetical protein